MNELLLLIIKKLFLEEQRKMLEIYSIARDFLLLCHHFYDGVRALMLNPLIISLVAKDDVGDVEAAAAASGQHTHLLASRNTFLDCSLATD